MSSADVPEAWISAANAAGLTLDMIDIEPAAALRDAAEQHGITGEELQRFLEWAQEYAE